MLLLNGVYLSDKLTDDEMFEILSEQITPEQLHTRRWREAEAKLQVTYDEYYTTKYTQLLKNVPYQELRRLHVGGYDNSPYTLTRSRDPYSYEDEVDPRKLVGEFENQCAVSAYYNVLKKFTKELEPLKKGKAYRQAMAKKHRGQSKSKNR